MARTVEDLKAALPVLLDPIGSIQPYTTFSATPGAFP